jgi:hypothetical protein
MWIRRLFGLAKPSKAGLNDYKKISLGGAVYTIRKINPMLDFPADRCPSVFTAQSPSRRGTGPIDPKRAIEDMMNIVRAGLVDPPLADPKAKNSDLITVEDIFRVPEHGADLYLAIMDHTLNRFRGLRRLFFTHRSRQAFYTAYRKAMEADQAQSPLSQEASV